MPNGVRVVDADRGFPDIIIDSLFATFGESGNTLVGVDLSNSGFASAEIAVAVRSEGTEVTKRVMVPARGKTIQRVHIQGRPTAVQADDGTVPETQASVYIKKFRDADDDSPEIRRRRICGNNLLGDRPRRVAPSNSTAGYCSWKVRREPPGAGST